MGRGSSAPGVCSRGHQRQPLPGAGSSQLSPQLVPPARGLGPSAAPASRRGGRVCAGGWELPLEPLRSAGWGSGSSVQLSLPSPTGPPHPLSRAGRRRCAGTPAPQPPHPPREAPVPSPTCVLCRGSRGGCGRVPGAGGAHPMERRGARCPARCGGGRGAGTASTPRILRSVGLATSSGRRMLGGAGAGLVLSPPPRPGGPRAPQGLSRTGNGACGCRHPAAPSPPGLPLGPSAHRRAAAKGGVP